MADFLLCSVPGCPRSRTCKGFCNPHYQRFYRFGDPLAGGPSRGGDPWTRFLSHVEVQPNGCWIWTASRDKDGYGKFKVGRKDIRAHVFAYTCKRGPVPKGLVLDHFVCDTPPCTNPDHVHPVTVRENGARGNGITALNARKTHCLRGHEFTPENTKPVRTKYGVGRSCRACAVIRDAKYKLAARTAKASKAFSGT